MINNCLTGILLLFCFHALYCQDDWQLRKEKDGISVYTRETNESDFKEFRATTHLDFSLATFLNIMWDVSAYPDWVSDLKSSHTIERYDDTAQVYYAEIKVPFPFENRDAVYYNRFIYDSLSQQLTISIDCMNGYVEEKEDLFRMPFCQGEWKAKSVGQNRLEVTLQMLVDPGGNIPAWLANQFIADSPYNTLKNLRSFGKKGKYIEP